MPISLINNIAFLIALTAVGQIIIARLQGKKLNLQVFLGLLFGGITILGMINPMSFSPGVIFDGRSIVLAVAGMIGGAITAAIAASLAAVSRFLMGGSGAQVGVATILISALLGVLARGWQQQRKAHPSALHYFLLGIVVQLAQLAAFTQLPDEVGYRFIKQAWWVLLLLYPLATMLLCIIFRDQEKRLEGRQALQVAQNAALRERAMLRTLIDALPDLIWLKDPNGIYIVGPAKPLKPA